MKFVTVDFVFLCIILICIIVSTVKGFISELFGKASWILGLICAFIFYDEVGALFTGVESGLLRIVIGFSITFVVVFLIFELLNIIFSRLVENDILSSLNRALGFLLGVGEGVAIVSLAIHFINWQDFLDKSFMNGSFFAAILG